MTPASRLKSGASLRISRSISSSIFGRGGMPMLRISTRTRAARSGRASSPVGADIGFDARVFIMVRRKDRGRSYDEG